jgi:hypothetical protein
MYVDIFILDIFSTFQQRMGNRVTRTDFEWSDQEEPHAKRRVEILSKNFRVARLFLVQRTKAGKKCTKCAEWP